MKEVTLMITIIYGFFIGIFVTLIGGGGASLYLGVLVNQLRIPTQTAVATSLLIALPALFLGFLSQLRVHNVQFKVGNQMFVAALPGILIGTLLSGYIPQNIYNWIVGSILAIMGGIVLWKYFRTNKKTTKSVGRTPMAIAFGLLSGLMVGIGGLSGGATTAAGLSILGLSTIEAAGTSTYILCLMSAVGFLSHLLNSPIAWTSGIGLMIGAAIGAGLTPLVLNRINQSSVNKFLTPFLGIIIIYFGVRMFF